MKKPSSLIMTPKHPKISKNKTTTFKLAEKFIIEETMEEEKCVESSQDKQDLESITQRHMSRPDSF